MRKNRPDFISYIKSRITRKSIIIDKLDKKYVVKNVKGSLLFGSIPYLNIAIAIFAINREYQVLYMIVSSLILLLLLQFRYFLTDFEEIRDKNEDKANEKDP